MKEDKEYTEFELILSFLICVGLFTGGLFGLLLVFAIDKDCDNCVVYIPDSNMVNARCKDFGYDNGWLSSQCSENQIMCHEKVGDLDKYECIYWDYTTK